ncbi:hypothetical protein ThrDRAFT_02212 [Frankia casuarinae]|uniref:Uncharacterized protein n=1 Tax=Frankia casuarinae (strain DSM 45818 / CECT 9043 / HFP020203 / CcI3) TaxID=106370 RepID=Q2J969_FRACC|nr:MULTISPECIES: hypothetical protein [Frankia]KDA43130.1 hypothetical protein BMG523Draft_02003 [Frankia sp. BMG5.23]KEZ36018.1 hypothetical protein CEDDRAFT_02621 [Frankia sp. CeD]KFB04866.1 hypothetical protein ALLO2DRAFT_02385 [Frankia sp. Allo2]ABD12173.1 conserved hypothetical protein [Frankia casuarinae]ETA02471.1 hypothetical protein CcI6DRAFT_02062 [Frankia sp. CcI6]
MPKPVVVGSVDLRRRQAREDACQTEVALNRRLAPDVYLAVADVRDEAGLLRDHMVVMRRLPVARRLTTLVERGGWVDPQLRDPGADRCGSVRRAAWRLCRLAGWTCCAPRNVPAGSGDTSPSSLLRVIGSG